MATMQRDTQEIVSIASALVAAAATGGSQELMVEQVQALDPGELARLVGVLSYLAAYAVDCADRDTFDTIVSIMAGEYS